eukprot:2792241-Pleurochrysis_carterae.AAC.3
MGRACASVQGHFDSVVHASGRARTPLRSSRNGESVGPAGATASLRETCARVLKRRSICESRRACTARPCSRGR